MLAADVIAAASRVDDSATEHEGPESISQLLLRHGMPREEFGAFVAFAHIQCVELGSAAAKARRDETGVEILMIFWLNGLMTGLEVARGEA